MLVILSVDALKSEWVRYEVQLARWKERKHTASVIVPLCLNPEIKTNSTRATRTGPGTARMGFDGN